MILEFISFNSSDKLELPGLLYSPKTKTRKAAVWLHGMGDNGIFYKPKLMNALGKALTDKGIALLAFNNRGAHNSKSLRVANETLPEEDRRYQGGTHYELIADCIKDINGAVNYLKNRGFTELYLLGLSSGANKICHYHAHAKKNPSSKYVLAGPGDDVGLWFQALGAKRFWEALKYAAKKIDTDPLYVMPKYTGMYPFSVQSAWDVLNPDGAYNTFPYYEQLVERLGNKPLFKEYRQIDRKTLVIIGEADEFAGAAGNANGILNVLMEQTGNKQLKRTDFVSVSEADHSFHGKEEEFAKKVSDWLAYD